MRLSADWRLRGYMALTLAFALATYALVGGAIYAAFVFVRRYAGLAEGVAVVAILALAAAAAGYEFATPRRVLARLDAKPAGSDEGSDATAALRRLGQQADVPTPELWIADREAPTSLSVGYTQRSPAVCVTTGLLDALDAAERDAVLAHEVAHIANRDAAVMLAAMLPSLVLGVTAGVAMFALTLAGTAGVAAEMGLRFGVAHAAERVFFLSLALLVVTVPVSILGSAIVGRFARTRELAADRTAASLTGDPAALATALRRLAAVEATVDVVSSGSRLGDFFILPVDDEDERAHPSVERRVERLGRLEDEFERR